MADDDQRLRDVQREYMDFLDDEVIIGGRSVGREIYHFVLYDIFRKIKVFTLNLLKR